MPRLLRLRLALGALVVVVPTVAGASGTTNASGPLTGITAIAAGSVHTCVVLASTEARCWGDNQTRQLGDGSTVVDSTVPVAVLSAPGGAPLTGIVAISAGPSHTCVVLASTEARCWGANMGGQLGVDDSRSQSIPVTVRASLSGEPLTGISSISSGRSHTCAVMLNGEARCWGTGGGLLGDNTVASSRVAVTVVANSTGAPLTGVTSVAAGNSHTCALLSSGTARCWGSNNRGQLGKWNKTPIRRTARSGPNLTGITSISAGFEYTCAVLSSGQARCWGDNTGGQLADGTAKKIRLGPVAVVSAPGQPALTGIADISAAYGSTTCVLMSIGQASCTDHGVPQNLIAVGAPLTDITALTTGGHSCALLSNGEARCWGGNSHGQLGDGTRNPSSSPVVVMA